MVNMPQMMATRVTYIISDASENCFFPPAGRAMPLTGGLFVGDIPVGIGGD